MAFTIEFLYEDGEPVRAPDDAVLDEDSLRSILKLRVGDVFPLGSGDEIKTYKIIRIKRNMRSGQISDSGEDEMQFDFVVRVFPDKG